MEKSILQVDPSLVRRQMPRVFALHEFGRELALAGLRLDHPQASPEELRRMLRERIDRFRYNKWGRESA
jgi:hypothetical protein